MLPASCRQVVGKRTQVQAENFPNKFAPGSTEPLPPGQGTRPTRCRPGAPTGRPAAGEVQGKVGTPAWDAAEGHVPACCRHLADRRRRPVLPARCRQHALVQAEAIPSHPHSGFALGWLHQRGPRREELPEGDLRPDGGALAAGGFDGQLAADHLHALSHAQQAQAFVFFRF